VLERVQQIMADRRLIEQREPPDIHVERPDRQRDDRLRQRTQPARRPQPQQRRERRTREPDDDEKRRDVADQQVLCHVRDQDAVGQVVRGRALHGDDDQDAGRERDSATGGHGAAVARQPMRAHAIPEPVGAGDDQRRAELTEVQQSTSPTASLIGPTGKRYRRGVSRQR